MIAYPQPIERAFPLPTSFSQAVQMRREFVAAALDEVCRRAVRPRILSVANGRMREAEAAIPLCYRQLGEMVVFDENSEDLQAVVKEHGRGRTRCVLGSLSQLGRHSELGLFDYIYALNVLGEVRDGFARHLIADLSSMLKRGGTLLLSTGTPEFQNWSGGASIPFPRTESDLAELALSARGVIGHAIWRTDPFVYLEIGK